MIPPSKFRSIVVQSGSGVTFPQCNRIPLKSESQSRAPQFNEIDGERCWDAPHFWERIFG